MSAARRKVHVQVEEILEVLDKSSPEAIDEAIRIIDERKKKN